MPYSVSHTDIRLANHFEWLWKIGDHSQGAESQDFGLQFESILNDSIHVYFKDSMNIGSMV